MNTSTILLIPEKTDPEFEQVFDTWVKQGGLIKRLGKYWIKDDALTSRNLAIYGNQAFALVLAQIYELQLLSPDDRIICSLEYRWIKRAIEVRKIYQLKETDFPVFIKPVIPKMFQAAVFSILNDFREVTHGLEESEEVLMSGIIKEITAEARSFIKEGVVKDFSIYEGDGDIESGKEFLSEFLKDNKNILPDVVVIDVAFSKDIGWFILEFNAGWGAGLNGCKAEKIIDCIVGATINPMYT